MTRHHMSPSELTYCDKCVCETILAAIVAELPDGRESARHLRLTRVYVKALRNLSFAHEFDPWVLARTRRWLSEAERAIALIETESDYD